MTLVGLEGKLRSAKLIADGTLLNMERPWNVSKFPNDAFLDLPRYDTLPVEIDTVIEFELVEGGARITRIFWKRFPLEVFTLVTNWLGNGMEVLTKFVRKKSLNE